MADARDVWPVLADDAVETIAREIQARGAMVPAMHFLEANRAFGPLGSQAMLFFDPVIRGVFGGAMAAAQELLADDAGIERLIDRLEELSEDCALDA